jgi:hemin transport system ATP-binding protein
MTGLQLRDVCVEVPDGPGVRVLLDHVQLTVNPGEVVVITGASGSGKSTLLAVAGLLRRPGAGEVVVAGVSTAGLSERARTKVRRDHIAIVYQSGNLFPSLTAREQLELVAHIDGGSRRSARQRADTLLRALEMHSVADQIPAQLSGGERQRVGIARALMGRPATLLADEPTASLDPALTAEVVGLLADQTRREALATVIVSHDDAPLSRADRHLLLSGGKLEPVNVVPG